MPPQAPTNAQVISANTPLLLTSNRPLRVSLPSTTPQPTCIEILASLPRAFKGRIELFLQVPPDWEGPRTLQPDSIFSWPANAGSAELTKASWTHCPAALPAGIGPSSTLLFRLVAAGKGNYVFIDKLGWSESSISSKPDRGTAADPS